MVKGFLPTPAPAGTSFIDRPDDEIIAIATGDCHAAALSTTGKVYFWGSLRDKDGKKWRCLPPSDDPRIRVEVNLRTAEEIEENKAPDQPPKGMQRWPIHIPLPGKAKKIACTASSIAAVMEDDTIITWGMGESGEMGRDVPPARNEQTGHYYLREIRDKLLKPTPITFGGPENVRREIVTIACGLYNMVVVVREYDGKSPTGLLRVYTCGTNNYGQLGWGFVDGVAEGTEKPTTHDTLEPVENLDGKDIVQVAAGENHMLARDKTGRNLYAWGRDDTGQLGITNAGEPDKYALRDRPTPVYLTEKGQENPVITHLACGSFNSLVVLENGNAWTWGFGENGALGHGRPPRTKKVVKPKEGEEEDITHIAEHEYWPRKLDVMAGVRRQEAKEGRLSSGEAVVQMMDGGAQHSVILVTRKQEF